LADQSTIFLDEIGEMPLELQPKLLRVLQEGAFERLGGSRTMRADVRVIAATNRNLEQEVQRGRFRKDLWYRLNVFPITVPPLRDRQEDIPILVNWFVKRFCKKLGKTIQRIDTLTMNKLLVYPWPGNVRELENVIERLAIKTKGEVLYADDEIRPVERKETGRYPWRHLNDMEHEYISMVLKETNWRISGKKGAALILGLNPNTLRGRMRKLNIRRQ
jgi:chemotaxis protein methyltransferase CheR